jgi:multiple sugar transport system substrate-binding protein/sn-glycerol 3-phosphate transport system substrate-binding protein
MRFLGILLVLAIVVAVVATPNASPTKAQDGSTFRATFDLVGPAEDGELAGIDPSGATVTYWHQHSGGREERLNEMIAGFNENNPWGITVEASNQGGYGDIYSKVIAGLSSGELPTMVVAYQNQSAAYKLGDAVADMNVFTNDATWGLNEEEAADFIPAFFNQDIAEDGTRIGFPPNRSLEALYYNKTALAELGYDAAPTTWEEFYEMSCAFTESGWSGYEGGDQIGYSIRTDASNVAAMTFALGGEVFDAETGAYTFNNEETAASLTFMQGLLNDGCANLIAEAFADQNDFAAGKNLFYVGSTSGLPFVLSAIQEGSENPFDWGVAYLPYAEAPVVNVYGASVTILQSDTITVEQQLAAWLFIRWFSETEQQQAWAEASQYFPVRLSATDSLANVFAQIPQYEEAWDLLLNGEAKFEPSLASYDVVRREVQAAFESILVEGADVESTLEALDVTANQIKAEFTIEAPAE